MNRRIKEIRVESLFGMFDHTIPLNMEERLTVVYGENGIGKTMIFRMLYELFGIGKHIENLFKKPFDKLCIIFYSGEILEVNIINQSLSFKDNKGIIQENQEVLYSLDLPIPPKFISNEFKEIIKTIDLHFIRADRLFLFRDDDNFDNPNQRVSQAITSFSHSLRNFLGRKHEEYRGLSEELELSLGKRLLNKEVRTDISYQELKEKLISIEKRQIELKSVGLLEEQEIINFEISKSIDSLSKAVIAVNIQDIKTKLAVYDDIYQRLRLFLDILNNRRLAYKKLSVSESQGFIITNNLGEKLSPNNLSSGEQHEIILLFHLLLSTSENTLVLIDEPEISLHVVWQKDFLNDMKKIIELRNIDILIATHSPSIINGNWDLTVSLKGVKKHA